jgi:hypothetical protein
VRDRHDRHHDTPFDDLELMDEMRAAGCQPDRIASCAGDRLLRVGPFIIARR